MNLKRKIIGLLLTVSLLVSVFAVGFALVGNAAQESGKGEIDVWLIGGQSNAVGYGEFDADDPHPESQTDSRYYTGFDNVLYYGEHEGLSNNLSDFVPLTLGMGQKISRSGAELGVAKALGNTQKMNAVIKVAWGATDLSPVTTTNAAKLVGTWTPPSYYDPYTGTGLANQSSTDELDNVSDSVGKTVLASGEKYDGEYAIGNMYRRFITVVGEQVERLREMGYTPVLRGMWWMQGEAECGNQSRANAYDEMLECLINDVRREMTEIFGEDQSDMPFAAGNIYRNTTASDYPKPYLHTVNLAQVAVSQKLENVFYLHNGHDDEWGEAVEGYTDQELFRQIDGWHFNAWTQQYFGEKFVEMVLSATDEYIVGAKGSDFTLENGGTHKDNTSVTVKFTADSGFAINSVKMSVGGAAETDITAELVDGSYTFTVNGANVEFTVTTSYVGEAIVTKYGSISAAYASSESYPFVLFKNGELVGGYNCWNDTLNAVTGSGTDECVILLRRDYTTNLLETTITASTTNLAAKLTLDLNGNTMTRAKKYIFDIYHNSSSTNTTEINIVNGTLTSASTSPFIGLNYGTGSAGYANKTYNITFDKVNFVDAATNRTTGLVFDCWENGKGTADTGVCANVVFNDCVFDGSRANTAMFMGLSGRGSNASDKTKVAVTVNGGSFIASNGNYTLAAYSSEDSVKIAKGESDKYPTVTLPAGVKAKYDAFSDMSGKLYGIDTANGVTSGNSVVYSFAEAGVVTPFGTVAEAYRDAKYKFIVFKSDESNVGYESWVAAITAAADVVSASSDKWAGIYLRSDYTTDSNDAIATKICHINGTVEINLGGNSLIKGNKTIFDLFSHPGSDAATTVVKVSDGTIKGESAIALDHHKNLTGTKVFKFDFEKVSFVGSAGNNPLAFTIWSNANNPSGATTMELNYNACEFDMINSGTQPIFNLSDVKDGRKSINVSLNLNGGAIKNMNSAQIVKLDTGDSFTIDNSYNGSYPTLSITEGTAPASLLTHYQDANDKDGRVSLAKLETKDGFDSYGFAASEKAGDYGYIPASYGDKTLYPFAFFKNGEFQSARASLKGYSGYGGSVAYLRTSIVIPEDWNPFGINGTFTIDLGGNTLTRDAAYFLNISSNANDLYDTKVIVKNGTLNSKTKWAIAFNQRQLRAAHKNMTLEFEEVTFKYDSTTANNNTDGAFFNCWGNDGDGDDNHYGFNVTAIYTDCTYDFTNSPSGAMMFNFVGTDGTKGFNEIDVKAIFKGGTIKTSNANNNWKLYKADVNEAKNATDGNDIGNSVFFENGTDGKPMQLIVINDNANAQPDSNRNLVGTNGTYYFVEESYTNVDSVKSHYYRLGTALTYEVFDADGNSLGKHTSWAYAVYAATEATKNGGTATIKLLGDGKVASNGGFAASKGTITVDLNGYTLSKVSDPYIVNSYYMNTEAVECKVIFKNGTIKKASSANANFGLFCINYASGANQNTEIATLNLEFNSVDFVSERNDNNFIFSLFENGKNVATAKGTYTEAVFNDCSFSYYGTVFNLTGNNGTKSVIDVVVNGGKLIPAAGSESKAIFTKDDLDSFTFAKLPGGGYTEMILAKGTAAPSTVYNGLKFTLKSEDETTATYVLASVTENIVFVPMASITLDSNLIFNIYIPEDNRITKVMVDGIEVELGAAEGGYYLVSTELSADVAARTIELVVTLDIDGTFVNGTFTFSSVKYVSKILSMDSVSTTEKTLARDMLAYVKSAYIYFEAADADAAADAIDAVIGTYVSDTEINTADAKLSVAGLKGASFVLEAKPAVRFYFSGEYAEGSYSFKVGGREIEASEIVYDSDGDGNYAQITLFAYEMIEVFSYEIADAEISGEYNLISYYADAQQKGDAALMDIVSKFYNYCESAKAYKG